MSSTVLTDVNYQSEFFQMQMQAAFTHKLELLASGALMPLPDELASPDSKGHTIAIPRWNVLSGDSVQITTSTTTALENLTDIKDIAAWMEREKAWAADQMVAVVAGKDVTSAVAIQLGEYWAGELHKSMISHLTGAFSTALASTHVHDASPNVISRAEILKAKEKLGDNQDKLTLALMNPLVYNDALAGLLIETPLGDSITQTAKIPQLLGMSTYQTELLAATADVYPTYLSAPSSMGYKFRNRARNANSNANVTTVNLNGLIIDIELNRIATYAGGQDQIITRCSYLTHIPGVQFDGTVASNPTNAQLATGTTWTKVQTDNKLIPLVKLATGIGAR